MATNADTAGQSQSVRHARSPQVHPCIEQSGVPIHLLNHEYRGLRKHADRKAFDLAQPGHRHADGCALSGKVNQTLHFSLNFGFSSMAVMGKTLDVTTAEVIDGVLETAHTVQICTAPSSAARASAHVFATFPDLPERLHGYLHATQPRRTIGATQTRMTA